MTAHTMTAMALADIIAHNQVGTKGPMILMLNMVKNLATYMDALQKEVTELKAENATLRNNNNNTSADY